MPYEGVGRRRELAAAALGRTLELPKLSADHGVIYGAFHAEILDVSPHLLIAEAEDGEELRLVIAPWATAWHGGPAAPADLPIGAQVIVKTLRSGTVVDRIWADITRATGIIRNVSGLRDITLELDCGPHRSHRTVVIPYRASGRVRVRYPQLEPGYLFDAIGLVDQGTTMVQLPATSQPPYRADDVPTPGYAGTQSKVSGTAVWSDLAEHGVAYPMLERTDTGCDDAEVSCARLPYLSLGSMLYVRNVCAGRANVLPIVACGCMAGRFCDRCVECGTSPRGRVAELSATAYVELGGELTKGCFNTRIGLG